MAVRIDLSIRSALLIVSIVAALVAANDKSDGPYRVLRIVPVDEVQLAAVTSLWKNASSYELDFWHSPTGVNGPVDVMVGPDYFEKVKEALKRLHLTSRVTVTDVQKLIESKQAKVSSGPVVSGFNKRYKDATDSFRINKYHSYAEIQQYMADLQTRYPQMAMVFTIGQTHEGRPIQLIKIGFPVGEPSTKKAFWIDGGIHAREWVAPSTALYFINQLLTNYDKDPIIRQYVEQLDWYILPVVNPDGYEYSRSATHPKVRLWRKNRSPSTCRWGSNVCCEGVDLNRNFAFHWGETGASRDPCDEIYAGTASFSEPETRAIRDFILQRPGRFDGFVTLHSYSQIWMYPYGHERRSYPADYKDLETVAIQAKRALQANYGTKYVVGTGADTLYPASGGSDDWAKETANIKYVYLIELRPEEHVWDGFILDENQILPTAKETWDGIQVVADAILQWNRITPLRPAPPPLPDRISNLQNQCVDKEPQCRWWASFGGCVVWKDMDKRCPRACRTCDPDKKSISPAHCTDKATDCANWKKLNLCRWVADSCALTCGRC